MPGLFTTEISGFDPARPIYFPPSADQDVPRYRYLGRLVGDENFIKERAKSGFYRFLEWVTGAIFGEATPRRLQRPQGGAVAPDGRILVADVGRSAVFIFDPGTGLLDVFDHAERARRFESPIGVAAGLGGDIFVADSSLGFVAHLASDGSPMAPVGVGTLGRPTGLAIDDAAGELFVADTEQHQIVVFDLKGHTVRRRLGQRGDRPGDLNFPTFLDLRDGELYVSDSMNARVQVLDPRSGRLLRQIGERGSYVGQLVRPKGVAVDSELNVYIVESFHDYLLIYDANGRFLLPIGGNGGSGSAFFLPSGVWVDRYDRVFLADVFNGRVEVFQFLGGDEKSDRVGN